MLRHASLTAAAAQQRHNHHCLSTRRSFQSTITARRRRPTGDAAFIRRTQLSLRLRSHRHHDGALFENGPKFFFSSATSNRAGDWHHHLLSLRRWSFSASPHTSAQYHHHHHERMGDLPTENRQHPSWNRSTLDSSSSSSSSQQRLVLLQKKKNEKLWTLHQCPVGTLSPNDWLRLRLAFLQAGRTMTIMLEQQEQSNTTSRRGRGEQGGQWEERQKRQNTTRIKAHDLLEHGWAILDRLAAERRFHIQAAHTTTASSLLSDNGSSSSNSSSSSSDHPPIHSPFQEQDFLLPIVDRPWVLFLWRHMVMMQQHQQYQHHDDDDDPIPIMSLPLVVDKLSTYLQLGLVPWTNDSATYLLDVVKYTVHPTRAPIVAMELLHRLEQCATTATGSAAAAPLLFPRNTVLTTQLIGLWAKSRQMDAPEQAMKLLQELKDTFRLLQQQHEEEAQQQQPAPLDDNGQVLLDDDNGNSGGLEDDLYQYRPDAHLYATVMHAWAKSSSSSTLAPQQAVDLFLEAQRDYDIQPTTFLYNNVIHTITNQVGRRHANGNSNNGNNGFISSCHREPSDLYWLREATNVFEGMVAKYRQQQGDTTTTSCGVMVRPTSASYSSILAAYMRVGQLHKALDLLHEMQDLARLDDHDYDHYDDHYGAAMMAPSDYCLDTCFGPLQECIQEHSDSSVDHTRHGDDSEQDFQQGAVYLQSLYRESSPTPSSSVVAGSKEHTSVDMIQILPTLDRLCLEVAMSPALLDLHYDLLWQHGDDDKISVISSLVDLALQNWTKHQGQHQHENHGKEQRGHAVDDRGILKRLMHYQQVGLLRPTNATLHWMISSLAASTSENDVSSSLRAQEMIDIARQACRYNVHDSLYHPNQIPMTRLAQLWAKMTASTTATGSHERPPQPSHTAPHHAAEAILALLKYWYHETNQRLDMKPGVPIYNAVVRALVRHGPDKDQVAQRAMELLHECMNHCNDGHQPSDNRCHEHALEELYFSVSKALVKSSLVEQAHAFFLNLLGTYLLSTKATPDKKEVALATIAAAAAKLTNTSTTTMMEQPFLQPTSLLRPTSFMISSLISAYTRQKRPDLAADFLRTMEKLYQETGDKSAGYAKVGQPEKVESTLQRMLQMSTTTASTTKTETTTTAPEGAPNQSIATTDPDVYSWNTMLVAWSKSDSPGAADRATALLKQLQQLQKESSSPGVSTTTGGGPVLDAVSYNCVLECYWRNPQAHRYAKPAEELLEAMETSDHVRPNANSYLLCLFVMRKAALGDRSIAILERFCRLYFEGKISPGEGPNTRHLNAVIGALGRTDASDAFNKAVGIVKVMEGLNKNQGLRVIPDRDTFESLLECALKSGKVGEIPERAEKVLGLMHQQWSSDHDDSVKPDAEMYSKIISAWGKTNRRDACHRLEALLDQMQLAQIQPNRQCFTNAMVAYRKHGRPEKVQAQFDAMVKAWKDGGGGIGGGGSTSPESSLLPNFPNYVTLLESWADAGQAARANTILEQLLAENAAGRIKGLPNTRHFSSVIRAWVGSSQTDAAEQAETLLNKMEYLSLPNSAASSRTTSKKKYPCRPYADTYASVISAHAISGKAGAAERADELLKRLESIYNETEDEKCRPTLIVYSEVLRAHLLTGSVSPTDNNNMTFMRVKELLDGMRSLPDSDWQNQGKSVCATMTESIKQSEIPERHVLVSLVDDIIRERLRPAH